MVKFLLTTIAVVILFRILMRLLFGNFMVKVEKHYYHSQPNPEEKKEGAVRIENTDVVKRQRYKNDEGDYTDYEEVKD
jgi:hypothetical protein